MRGKARAVGLKRGTRHAAARGGVLRVGLVCQPKGILARHGRQPRAVALDLFLCQRDGAHEHIGAERFGQPHECDRFFGFCQRFRRRFAVCVRHPAALRAVRPVACFVFVCFVRLLLQQNIAVIRKAHGHIVGIAVIGERVVLMVVDIAVGAVLRGKGLRPAVRHHDIFHAQKPPQGIDPRLGLGGYVPLYAHARIKIHNGGGYNAVKALQHGFFHPQAQIVVAAVGVEPVKMIVWQIGLLCRDGALGAVFGVPLPLRKLAQRDMHYRIKHRKAQNAREQHTRKILFLPDAQRAAKQQEAQNRRKIGEPELRLALHNADAPYALFPLGHQSEHRKQHRNHRNGPQPVCQINALILQSAHGGGAHHQNRHIVPARVVAGIQRVERGIQHRHQRHHKACPQNFGKGRFGPRLQVRPHARTAYNRQKGRHAGVLNHGIGKDIGQIGGIGRQKQRGKNGKVLLHAPIKQKAEAAGEIHRAGIVLQAQHGGPEQRAPHCHAQQRFKRQPPEALCRNAVFPRQHLGKKIKEQKYDLPGKKEIVVQKIHGYRQREQAARIVINRPVQRTQQKREQRDAIDKMVEKRIVDGKARKRIQARADYSPMIGRGVPAQIPVRAKRRHAELDTEHRNHRIRNPRLRQQQRQPEKRRAAQVKRIRIHGRGTQIRLPAPLPGARFDKAVHICVKRDLLAVKIAAVLEQAAVHHQKRQKDQKRRRRAQRERKQRAAAGGPGPRPCKAVHKGIPFPNKILLPCTFYCTDFMIQ